MSKQFFAIQFEDYSLPESFPMPKTYYGTLHQIKAVMDDLAADPITAAKYASTIQAFEEYTEGFLGATHEISGQRLSLLTPVQLIHETMIVQENPQWYFSNGVYSHRVRADYMSLHQVLLKDEKWRKRKMMKMMEQTDGYVVAGAFEDDLALMNKEQYYSVRLAHTVYPDCTTVVKEYFGTLEQIRQLIYLLASEEWTREYYTSTISAMDSFDFGNLAAVHDVAGRKERLLTPVSELCRSAYLCGGAQWYYTDQYGCVLPAKAELVDVEQVLLQDGDRYLRCGKFRFEGLSNAMPLNGLTLHAGYCEGVSHIGQCCEPGAIQMRLFVLEQEYTNETIARRDMATEGLLDYTHVSGELFSGV